MEIAIRHRENVEFYGGKGKKMADGERPPGTALPRRTVRINHMLPMCLPEEKGGSSKTTFISFISCLSGMLAILIVPRCATMGPDYVPPKTSVSKNWHTQLKGA
jgi:hypothetical protein